MHITLSLGNEETKQAWTVQIGYEIVFFWRNCCQP